MKIIMDVDTGTDDAIGLMLAHFSNDLEIVGVTTVNGNCAVEVCTENTLRLFDYLQINCPVYEGCSAPISRPMFERGDWTQLFTFLPSATTKKQEMNAVDWIINTYLTSNEKITLIAIGPLTNIAMALRMEPSLVNRIPEIVYMGGGHLISNDSIAAEYNILVDPEAARIVIKSGIPIRMLPLDATHKVLISEKDCINLQNIDTSASILTSKLIKDRIKNYDANETIGRPGSAPVHDALAVAAVIDPSIIDTRYIYVDIETIGELTYGRTVCDFANRSKYSPNIHFAINADENKFKEMLFSILKKIIL